MSAFKTLKSIEALISKKLELDLLGMLYFKVSDASADGGFHALMQKAGGATLAYCPCGADVIEDIPKDITELFASSQLWEPCLDQAELEDVTYKELSQLADILPLLEDLNQLKDFTAQTDFTFAEFMDAVQRLVKIAVLGRSVAHMQPEALFEGITYSDLSSFIVNLGLSKFKGEIINEVTKGKKSSDRPLFVLVPSGKDMESLSYSISRSNKIKKRNGLAVSLSEDVARLVRSYLLQILLIDYKVTSTTELEQATLALMPVAIFEAFDEADMLRDDTYLYRIPSEVDSDGVEMFTSLVKLHLRKGLEDDLYFEGPEDFEAGLFTPALSSYHALS